jgi:hydrogenase maturation protein HypF
LGFQPYWHQRVPSNDGGISLGQIYAARIMNTGRLRVGNELVEEGAP